MALLKLDEFGVTLRGAMLLEGIAFTIGKGQRFGLIGESGAGKTSIALAIMGLLPAYAEIKGSLSFDDAVIPADEASRAKLRGKRIGMVFQDAADALDPLQSAGTQIAEAIQLAGQANDLRASMDLLLRDVGLEPDLASRFPHQLSASERQRVAIAIALAGKPELLIADEPTAGLDLIAQRKVIDLIDRLCAERGMALMYISHDLKAVALLCTRIAVLRAGKIVELGDKLDVLGHPKHDYTKLLLAAGRHRAKTLMRAPIGGDLLVLRNVSRRFRQPDLNVFQPRPPLLAVDDVSFTLRAGKSLALIGPSGAGKSTLARLIVGLDRVTSGELQFDQEPYRGSDIPRLTRRDISLVFPDAARSFNPRLTVGESVAEPLRLEAGAEMEDLSQRLVETVNAVGLSPDMLSRFPHEFSSGQLPRLAIARALITRPRLIVLDEPVSSLDVAVRGEILVMLNRLRADFGLTFLVIGHDLDTLRIVADRVLVMDKGRIVETSTPAQLLERPQKSVSKALIAAALPDVGIVPVL